MNTLHELPDGRHVRVAILDAQPDQAELGPLWEVVLVSSGEVLVGHPLNAALADLLGYDVAHEEWPAWLDDLAARIEHDASS